jgi:hypothetical protein
MYIMSGFAIKFFGFWFVGLVGSFGQIFVFNLNAYILFGVSVCLVAFYAWMQLLTFGKKF